MAFTQTWNEDSPDGSTQYVSVLDNSIQNLKYAFRERLAVDHRALATEAGSNMYYHKAVHLIVQATPDAVANTGIVYAKDVSAKGELHYLDEDDNEIQFSTAGEINLAALSGGNWAPSADINIDSNTFVVDISEDRIGVNTATPEQGIHVVDGGAIIALFESSDDDEVVAEFRNQGGDNWRVGHDTNTFNIKEDNTSRLAIASGGAVTIGGTVATGALTVTGNITVSGNVDGVDVAALKTDVDGFPNELKNLTTAEIQQLENIGTNAISNNEWEQLARIGSAEISSTEWGYVAALNQSLTTTSNVSHNKVTVADTVDITVSSDTYTASNNVRLAAKDLTAKSCLQIWQEYDLISSTPTCNRLLPIYVNGEQVNIMIYKQV